MFFIILLGVLLRLSYIIKPEGMWNDEYVSWMIANIPVNEGLFSSILKQCHMPLYYLYLKPFTHYNDLILRLTSLVPGVISIYIMFLVGKEYSKKTGYFAAGITSVLSFLVYYSQEVRFYSLLFLFSSFVLLYSIKTVKEYNKINFLLLHIFSLLVIFTHVLGCIFIFFNYLYLFYKIKSIKFEFNKKSIICILCILTFLSLVLFFGINILKQLPSAQWWGNFSYTNILFLFSDFFSPVLTNNINAPQRFFYNSSLSVYMVIPTVVSLIGIILGCKKFKGFLGVVLCFTLILCILAKFGIIVFITKYLMETLPIFIICISYGFANRFKFGNILFGILIFCHLFAFFQPFYVTKLFRSEGHKIPAAILQQRKAQNVIFTYYAPDRFNRYIDLKDIKTYIISKNERHEYVNEPQKIFKSIPDSAEVSIVFLDSVCFFPENYIKQNNNLPEMFVTFSHIKNRFIQYLIDNDYKILYNDTFGSWSVLTFINKPKNIN